MSFEAYDTLLQHYDKWKGQSKLYEPMSCLNKLSSSLSADAIEAIFTRRIDEFELGFSQSDADRWSRAGILFDMLLLNIYMNKICKSCSQKDRVINYVATQGKHALVNTNATAYQSKLITNSITHGTSKILSFGETFAAEESKPPADLNKKKLFEEIPELSLAFIIKIEYNATNANSLVSCNSAFAVATQDRSYHPSPNNFGGVCGLFCATDAVNTAQPERSFEFFKGESTSACQQVPLPGPLIAHRLEEGSEALLTGAKISNDVLENGPYGNGQIKSVMLADFPNPVPARYAYDIELIGRAVHTYYGNCWNGISPFALISRFVDSSGSIFNGTPDPFCVALCAGDLGIWNANYNEKQEEVQSIYPELWRYPIDSFAEWSIADFDEALYAEGQDDQNFKFTIPFGRTDSFCVFDPPPRKIEFGTFIDPNVLPNPVALSWPKDAEDNLHMFHWRQHGFQSFRSTEIGDPSEEYIVNCQTGSAIITINAESTLNFANVLINSLIYSAENKAWSNRERKIQTKISDTEIVLNRAVVLSPIKETFVFQATNGSNQLTTNDTSKIRANDTILAGNINSADLIVDAVLDSTTLSLSSNVALPDYEQEITGTFVSGSAFVTLDADVGLSIGDAIVADSTYLANVASILNITGLVIEIDQLALDDGANVPIITRYETPQDKSAELEYTGIHQSTIRFSPLFSGQVPDPLEDVIVDVQHGSTEISVNEASPNDFFFVQAGDTVLTAVNEDWQGTGQTIVQKYHEPTPIDISTTFTPGSLVLGVADSTQLLEDDEIQSGQLISGTITDVSGSNITISGTTALSDLNRLATYTNGSNIVVLDDTTGIVVGDTISSTTIGTASITSIINSTDILIDVNATADETEESATIQRIGTRTLVLTYELIASRPALIADKDITLNAPVLLQDNQADYATSLSNGNTTGTVSSTFLLREGDTISSVDLANSPTIQSIINNTTYIASEAFQLAQPNATINADFVLGSNIVFIETDPGIVPGDTIEATGYIDGPVIISSITMPDPLASKPIRLELADNATDSGTSIIATLNFNGQRTIDVTYSYTGTRQSTISIDTTLDEFDDKQIFDLQRLPYEIDNTWYEETYLPNQRIHQYLLVYSQSKSLSSWKAVALAELKGIEHDFALTVDLANINLAYTENDILYAGIKHGYYEPDELDIGTQILSSFVTIDYSQGLEIITRNVPRDPNPGTLYLDSRTVTEGGPTGTQTSLEPILQLPANPPGNYGYDTYILPGDDIPADISECQNQLRHSCTIFSTGQAFKAEHSTGKTGTELGADLITLDSVPFKILQGSAASGADGCEEPEAIRNEIDAQNVKSAINNFLAEFAGLSTTDIISANAIRVKPILQ